MTEAVIKRTTSILALLPLIAVVNATLARTASSQTRDERAIRAASEARQRYVATKNVDSIVALYTPTAILIPSNAPPMKGSPAIRKGWSEIVKMPGLTQYRVANRIEIASPAIATEYGSYAESYETPGGRMRESGNYVTIWNKLNGKWRVALDAPVSTLPIPAQMSAEESDFVARSDSSLSWSDFSPVGVPPGGKISVLHGDPFSPGRFVLRLSLPDGYRIPLHWLTTAEDVTVLSGSVQLGIGDMVDPAATQTYAAGDFLFIPARQPHWLQAQGATVLQVTGNGPFQLNPGVPK